MPMMLLKALESLCAIARTAIMALKPLTYEDSFFRLLREGDVKEFNRRKGQNQSIALTDCDFRHLDLRGIDAVGIDLSNSYFRTTDLRGINFPTRVSKTRALTTRAFPALYSPPSSRLKK